METVTLFTPSEVSALTDLSVKRVNKIIDEQLPRGAVRKKGGRRLVTFDGAVCVALDGRIAPTLTLKSRKQVFRHIIEDPDARAVFAARDVKVEVASTRRAIKERRRRLTRIMTSLTRSDPEVLGGALCFRGTRIPVHLIAELLCQGAPEDELLEDYPSLSRTMIEAAPLIAKAYPKRGRPPKQPWQSGRPVGTTRVKRAA